MTNALHAEPASTPAPLALSAKAKSTPSTPISAFPAAPAQILAPAVLLPRDKFPPNVTTHTKKRETACRSLSLFWINLPLIFQAVFGFTRETLCQMWKTGINPLRLMQKWLLWTIDAVSWILWEKTHFVVHTTPLSSKKVFEKNLHFLHQAKKIPIKPSLFRCRIGCRIFLPLSIILHQQHRFSWLHALFRAEWCRMQKGKAHHAKTYLSTTEDNKKDNYTQVIRKTIKNPAVLCCIWHGIIRKCRILRPQERERQNEQHGKCRIHPTPGLNPTPYPSPETPNK